MKKKFLLLTLLLVFSLLTAGAHSSVSFNYGYFLAHSENNTQIMNDKDFSNLWGITLHHEFNLGEQIYLRFGAGYERSHVNYYDLILSDNGTNLGIVKTHQFYENYIPIDLQLAIFSRNMTGYGIGASLIFTEHGLVAYVQPGTIYQKKHQDIFSSFGIGPSAFLNWGYRIPETGFKLLLGVSIRYAVAIRFYGDQKRDFSDYEHHYLLVRLNVGLGR